MELLYTTRLSRSKVHAVAWSGLNLVAISVSVDNEGIITEGCKRWEEGKAVCNHCVYNLCNLVYQSSHTPTVSARPQQTLGLPLVSAVCVCGV